MPDWAQHVRPRLSALRLSPTRENEIVDELSQHLEDRWRDLMTGGASEEAAARLALAEFREENLLARYMTPLRQAHAPAPITPGAPIKHVLGDLWQDLRYALRTMAAGPGFTAVAILSLALGIGANTAIFSLWDGVLHASLPAVSKPDELVMLSNPDQRGTWTGRTSGPRNYLTYEEFEQLRDHADLFSAMMASQTSLNTWQVHFEDGSWEAASGRLVSGGFFEVLGVGAAIGRVFTAPEDHSDVPYAVMSNSYWQRRFGGRPDVLGKTFTVRKTVFTVIGVAPPGFVGETSGAQPDLWLPLRRQPSVLPGRDRLHDTPPEKQMWLHVFGRLKPGVTLTQAEAQANAVFQAGLESFYGAAASGERRRELLDQSLQIRPAARGASSARRQFSQSLTALLVAVGVVLLIACANLANLLLARGTARQTELAVRLSLGASRGRLIRQLVTECLMLAAIGSVAAIAVASVLHGALVRMMAASDSRFQMTFALDPLVLAFVLAATVTALLVFGVLPAWQVTKLDVGASLKEQTRGAIGRFGQLRSGRLLVSLQLALSLPLLVGAGLLARTVFNLQRVDLGFPAERLLLVRLDLRELGDEIRRATLVRELLEQIQRSPGVRATSFSLLGLFSGGEASEDIEVEGYTPHAGEDRESALDVVGPGYFAALGVPITLGRDILERDQASAPTICVINDAFARRFFQGRNPIGMRITPIEDDAKGTACQVVGIAKNARTHSLRDDAEPRFFVAAAQQPSSLTSPTFLIRTTTDTGLVMAAVGKTIQQIDASMTIMSAASIEQQMAPLTAQDRTTAQLAVVFGSVALLLAAIGLYGVLSYGIARRTGEIAIRIALGAQTGRVISMILRETSGVVGVGLGLGGGLAYAASRLIDRRLYGVAPQDPLVLAFATGLLVLVAFSAAYVPARRASRLDPMVALRQG
jgi:putative ABC transport system permease protein